jgi:N-acetyl-anhydromuramyl-L-alanine amidase AmpD
VELKNLLRKAAFCGVVTSFLLSAQAFGGIKPDYSGAAAFVPADPSNYSNYSRTANDIDTIVIHVMQGYYNGTKSWFQNPSSNVSAHYIVRSSDGEVTQMVKEEDVAWHAGNWTYNEQSVGIELEGFINNPSWFTEAMYQSSAKLTRDIALRNNIPLDRKHIIGHIEVPGATHTDPGPYWDWNHYMTLVTVPEPASLLVLSMGGLALLRRKR